MNKLVIAGGSGFLGTVLAQHFKSRFQQVVILCRGAKSQQENIKHVQWDARTLGSWATELDGCSVLINLTGKNVNCRYTSKNKREILASRLDATRVLGEAIRKAKRGPALWLQASSSTIYNHSFTPNTEQSTNIGHDFSMTVCQQWEEAFKEQHCPATTKVLLRIAIVLGPEGGAWPVLHTLTKWGLGGPQGSGTQLVSWIYKNDLIRAFEWIMNQGKPKAVYNICHPQVVSNRAFMQALRKFSGIPLGLPQPGWLLKLGAVLVGTETELVLKSRAVAPAHLLEEGFEFNYDLEKALEALAS